ncbi:MAG: dihydropteroate synthase [Proteobacteria bacterium]|nr:dihydropteroate synthase [Pseudomonadota bacterium]
MVKIVGILNVTPDSFSDGGKFNSLDNALIQLKKMIDEGADVIDIGAESTRPNAVKITAEEEWQRLEKILPEIIKVVKNSAPKIKTSIDSYHFETLKKAHEIGVDVINDVTGLSDARIIDFIAAKNIETILMHNLQIPAVQGAVINRNINLIREIISWAQQKIFYLEQKKVKKSQLIFDPGIGFAKDALQSIRILKNIEDFRILGLPIYVGHSKKSFLEAIDFSDYGENLNRAEKTLIISKYLKEKNVDYLRVHEVKATIDFCLF